jgi:hypothetical protein
VILSRCAFVALGSAFLAAAFSSNAASPLETIGDTAPSDLRSTFSPRPAVSTQFGTSYQVNVSPAGQNILGDAANEPSLCLNPLDPRRIAIGWRQFNSVTNNFRQAGWGYSTNGGATWLYGGVLETNIFRSDPVLASDATGRFYYLSLQQNPLRCDLWRSTNNGANWQNQGPAVGGDKAWMTVDASASPGRGTVYQAWSNVQNVYSNHIFSLSPDGGIAWSNPVALPQTPFWGTLDVGPRGELYLFGWNGSGFWLTRSLNATNHSVPLAFDLSTQVNLGGNLITGGALNPEGLLGQPWIAVDKSSGPTRGNLYALCSVSPVGNNPVNVMFSRSTNGGTTWSVPIRLNTDSATLNAWHWFGTLSVAPNGRVDACWYDTRSNPNNNFSELYYCFSTNAGLTWATNRAVSPAFNHTLGYPSQAKIGDYIGMVSLKNAACIAYTATFNSEQDVYFLELDQPIVASIARVAGTAQISWNAVIGKTYCVQYQNDLTQPWSVLANLPCLEATNTLMQVIDPALENPHRFYRIAPQPPQ